MRLSFSSEQPSSGLFILFALICTAPFLSIWRVGPLSGFYLESGSLLLVLLFVLASALKGCLNTPLPRGVFYFLLLAGFWWCQARIMDLPYYGQNDMVVWVFIVAALAAWAVRGWVNTVGQEEVVTVFAWTLLFGALCQSFVVWIQVMGWSHAFHGWIMPGSRDNVMGQLGQRNHLGHYMMWGILSAAYLWSQRRLHTALGAVFVSFLVITISCVNSRTILIYVIALALLTILWRIRAGRSAGRITAIFLYALTMVVAVQFLLNAAAGWFGGARVETALSRVENSSFAMSGRYIEWHKAWDIIQTQPWWGYGWGSYSLQGFLAKSPTGNFIGNYEGVLFTHCHNLILQLLVEMGIVGTAVVLLGALWVVLPFFRQPMRAESLFPVALMTVSLCHSMLEYPLWYVYFLMPFVIMMSLTPPERVQGHFRVSLMNWAVAGVALVLGAGIVRLGFVYDDLVRFDRNTEATAQESAQRINGLLNISDKEPLLAYYADLSLSRKASPYEADLVPWTDRVQKALHYRPFGLAYDWAAYEYRLGNRAVAEDWIHHIVHYYPYKMAYYAEKMNDSPYVRPLYPVLYGECQQFLKEYPNAEPCPAPKM